MTMSRVPYIRSASLLRSSPPNQITSLMHDHDSLRSSGREFVDLPQWSRMCSLTGGTAHLVDAPQSDLSAALSSSLVHSAARPSGRACTFKLRASRGIDVVGFCAPKGTVHTHFSGCELEAAGMDSDSSVVVDVEVASKLSEDAMAYFQSATLYTNADGRRVIRVCTLAVPTSDRLQDVFRCSDMDALACVLGRRAAVAAAWGGSSVAKDPS